MHPLVCMLVKFFFEFIFSFVLFFFSYFKPVTHFLLFFSIYVISKYPFLSISSNICMKHYTVGDFFTSEVSQAIPVY